MTFTKDQKIDAFVKLTPQEKETVFSESIADKIFLIAKKYSLDQSATQSFRFAIGFYMLKLVVENDLLQLFAERFPDKPIAAMLNDVKATVFPEIERVKKEYAPPPEKDEVPEADENEKVFEKTIQKTYIPPTPQVSREMPPVLSRPQHIETRPSPAPQIKTLIQMPSMRESSFVRALPPIAAKQAIPENVPKPPTENPVPAPQAPRQTPKIEAVAPTPPSAPVSKPVINQETNINIQELIKAIEDPVLPPWIKTQKQIIPQQMPAKPVPPAQPTVQPQPIVQAQKTNNQPPIYKQGQDPYREPAK